MGFTHCVLSQAVRVCAIETVNFCNESGFFFFFFKESQKIKTGKLMKNTTLSIESLNSGPHLPQPRGLWEGEHRPHEGAQSHWSLRGRVTRCMGTHGETASVLNP